METNEKREPVAYWFVEKYQLVRERFIVLAIFNEEDKAKAFAAEASTKPEPAIVNGVLSFAQLVDYLIRDRFWPIAELVDKPGRELIAGIAREEIRNELRRLTP